MIGKVFVSLSRKRCFDEDETIGLIRLMRIEHLCALKG
jgi:hypothetical protein